MAGRLFRFLVLLLASWTVMTFTHEAGHLLGGWCSGGTLQVADLYPWSPPHSVFEPDPRPLVTLWCGPWLGVLLPLAAAIAVRRDEAWFIAHFCVLANGVYLATSWLVDAPLLDTPRLLDHGASPVSIALFCLPTILLGYLGFRRSCRRVFFPR